MARYEIPAKRVGHWGLIKVDINTLGAAQAIPGPAGPQGDTGSQGETGPQGPAGADGEAGPQGVPGDAGPQGEVGPKGDTGAQGPKGDAGAQGDAGPKGDTGSAGAQGIEGQAGAQGVQGDAGAQGQSGAQGATGPQGNPGADGAQGIQGIQGSPGNNAPSYGALADGTTAMAFATAATRKVTPTASATFTTTVPAAGTVCHLIILTSGTTSRTITFGSGFKPVGTLATGTTSARVFVVHWISDGTNLYEAGRTAAMVA